MALAAARGPVRLSHFSAVDPQARDLARHVNVELDDSLPEFGAVLICADAERVRVPSPAGSPDRPISAADLADKVRDLSGDSLAGVLDDLDVPAAGVLRAAGLDV